MEDSRCVDLLRWALPKMAMRWEGFRKPRAQVCKRIERRMAELDVRGAEDYRSYLREHPGEWEVLARLCRVTISRFMRDREIWRWLFAEHLPGRAADLAGQGPFRVWSAGCTSGEEPYTVSLLWMRHVAPEHPDLGLEVLGTDIDEQVVERARRGCYPRSSLKELDEGSMEEAFRRSGPPGDPFCLAAAYRQAVRFQVQDLREELPEGTFQLILCRNLAFTYYEEALQREVLERLRGKLRADGLLVVGSNETLPEAPPDLEPLGPGGCIWRKARAAEPTGGAR